MIGLDIAKAHSWSSYRRLLRYCTPYKKRIFAALACMLLASVFGIAPPWLIKNVVDDVLIAGHSSLLNFLAGGVVLLYVCKAVFTYGHLYLMTWVGQKVVIDLRLELFWRIQHLAFATLYGRRTGEFLSLVTNDVAVLQNILASTIVEMVVQGVTFVGILLFLLFLNWKLTLFTFLITPLAILAIDRASAKLRVVGRTIQEQLARVTAIAQEAISAVRIVRAFATEENEYERFKDQSNRHFGALMKGTQIRGVLEGAVEVILIAALALILWIGGRDVVAGRFSVGELLAFLTYLGLLVQPVRVLSRTVSAVQQGVASADRVFEILDVQETIASPVAPVLLRPMAGRVDFEDVWFAYEGDRWVLRELSFSANPGDTIAIVGATGTGKSTLADMILRFYDPSRGCIRVDGHDIRTLDLRAYRKQIGLVPQDPMLMKGSFAYNIGYGLETPDLGQIEAAARTAGIHAFIESLPEGYDTEIGERGVTLSGGQRQRVAIARAVVRDPRILIMDEATSSLDVQVEKQVQEAMNKAMQGRTSFVIAHRLTTVRNATRILVLEAGRIAEAGTHDELVALGGRYRKLYGLYQEGRDDVDVGAASQLS